MDVQQAQLHHDRLHIGGEWVEPSDGRVVDVINPMTEEPIGRAALGGSVGHRSRGPRRAGGLRRRPVGRVRRPPSARRSCAGPVELIAARAEEFARRSRSRSARRCQVAERQPVAARLFLDWHAAQARTFPWEEERAGRPGPDAGAPPAGRSRRRDRAVELPARAVVPEARSGAADRLHRRPQAARGDAAVRLPAGGGRSRRPACRRACSTSCPADREVERGAGQAPAGRQDQLHGQHARGAPDRLAVRRADQALQPRARRQVRRDRAARCRPRRRRSRRSRRTRCATAARPASNQTRVLAPRERYADVVDALAETIGAFPIGDPADPDVFDRPAGQRRAARSGSRATSPRPRRGRSARARRRPPRPRPRLLRGADALRRRGQRDDDRAGGDLRPRRAP